MQQKQTACGFLSGAAGCFLYGPCKPAGCPLFLLCFSEQKAQNAFCVRGVQCLIRIPVAGNQTEVCALTAEQHLFQQREVHGIHFAVAV